MCVCFFLQTTLAVKAISVTVFHILPVNIYLRREKQSYSSKSAGALYGKKPPIKVKAAVCKIKEVTLVCIKDLKAIREINC